MTQIKGDLYFCLCKLKAFQTTVANQWCVSKLSRMVPNDVCLTFIWSQRGK